MSETDLQYAFEEIIRQNLCGFAAKRSVPTVKQAMFIATNKYLGFTPQNKGFLKLQNLVINNQDVFAQLLRSSLEEYKTVHKYETEQKEEYAFNDTWVIHPQKAHNPNTTKAIKSELSLYQPLYIETKDGKADQLEIDFIDYMENHSDKIEYFWKNGSEHMQTNFGIKLPSGSAFQPDFLVQFADGRVGIFDTKAGKGFNEADNKIKSEALIQYISDEKAKGKKLCGGLVINANDNWYFNDRNVYQTYEQSQADWKNFDELLK